MNKTMFLEGEWMLSLTLEMQWKKSQFAVDQCEGDADKLVML